MAPSSTALLRRFITKAKFRHMEVLLRVSELGSMRRAAEAVGMTQPSISQLIVELETLLETQLFFRHARGVESTEATLELLPIARRILNTLGEGAELLANRLEESDGVVRVVASEAGILGLIYPVLPEFADNNRGIHLTVNTAVGSDPLALIAEDACDILCVRRPEVIPKGWAFEICQEDALITACGRNHPLASQKSVTLEMLGQYRWLMNRVDSVARSKFEEIREREGWSESTRCNVIMHIPDLTMRMLETGDYLALLPRSVIRPFVESGQVVELDCEMQFDLGPLGFVWREDSAGRAVSIFASYLRGSKQRQFVAVPPAGSNK